MMDWGQLKQKLLIADNLVRFLFYLYLRIKLYKNIETETSELLRLC